MILFSNFFFLLINNIDTDLIIPKQFLNTLKKSGFKKCLFFDLKYIINNNILLLNKDFDLNNKKKKNCKILFSLKNFGCGSSREHAVWAIKDFNIKIIIAENYSDIFYDNSMKNNLILIKLKEQIIKNIIFNNNFIYLNIKFQFLKNKKNIYYFYLNNFYKKILINNMLISDFILEKKKKIFLFIIK